MEEAVKFEQTQSVEMNTTWRNKKST